MEATPRFELGNRAFAELCLTTWLCRRARSSGGCVPFPPLAKTALRHRIAALPIRAKTHPNRGRSRAEGREKDLFRGLFGKIPQAANRLGNGAGNEIRTRDFHLGKVTLYH